MNTLLIEPADVLFFKDGRPMAGGLPGYGAAWPLPHTLNSALHAALYRAGIKETHPHPHKGMDTGHERVFGSLVSVGPFPVIEQEGARIWFFPRPGDAQKPGAISMTHRPVETEVGMSSAAPFLRAAPANTEPPSKEALESWWSGRAFAAYLQDGVPAEAGSSAVVLNEDDLRGDDAIFLREATIGIGIDSVTGVQDGERFYSAHYLRLKKDWQLGLLAQAVDQGKDGTRELLLGELFAEPGWIIVGGQQRSCHTRCFEGIAGVLPRGLNSRAQFRALKDGKFGVKWVLLSPAIWPEIPRRAKNGESRNPHPGGWLPNWVSVRWDPDTGGFEHSPENGTVLLTRGPGRKKAQRKGLKTGEAILARLVAAIVPKPLVVTGWALPHLAAGRAEGGAKSTQLAVPAGAVYYFEADSQDEAVCLAAALNWHGGFARDGTPQDDYEAIQNRRSILLGEKGFGLGVCGTWGHLPLHGAPPV